jgi:hypothetical protein
MKNVQEACPHPLQRKTLIDSIPRFWIIDGLLSMKWRIICLSAMVLLTESSKIDLAFIKFVQDGFQNKSQQSTSVIVYQSAKDY